VLVNTLYSFYIKKSKDFSERKEKDSDLLADMPNFNQTHMI
jgi:hypothetical protein